MENYVGILTLILCCNYNGEKRLSEIAMQKWDTSQLRLVTWSANRIYLERLSNIHSIDFYIDCDSILFNKKIIQKNNTNNARQKMIYVNI